jgi:hypothetical protein
MNMYWIEFIKIILPGLTLKLISTLPLALGTLAAIRHLLAGRTGPYVRNLCGAIAAGVVTLGLLWSSLFGGNLSNSSTAGLIFLWVPIYSAAALLVGYLMGVTIVRASHSSDEKNGASPSIPAGKRKLIWIPVAMFMIVTFGITSYSILHNDLSVAEDASHPETLRYVFEKAATGKADTFGVPLFLAQNPNAPADVLEKLSKSNEPQVRAFVATNPNTPVSIVASLRGDCADYVRKAVRERLKDALGSDAALQPTQRCK